MKNIKIWKMIRERVLSSSNTIVNISRDTIWFDQDTRYGVNVAYVACDSDAWRHVGYANFLFVVRYGKTHNTPEAEIKLSWFENLYIRSSFKRLVKLLKKIDEGKRTRLALESQETQVREFMKKFMGPHTEDAQ